MKSVNSIFILFSLLTATVFSAEDKKGNDPSLDNNVIKRIVDPKVYSYGQKLFLKNCATCHGKNAEGDKNWRKLNEQGKYPPPPLNGSGHTWHHSIKALTNVIKNGTGKIGGNMPAWKDRLSDKDIAAILVYIQAQWPDEIYTAWYNTQHKEK